MLASVLDLKQFHFIARAHPQSCAACCSEACVELRSLSVAPRPSPAPACTRVLCRSSRVQGSGPLLCRALLPLGCKVGAAEHAQPFWRPDCAPTSRVCTAGRLCSGCLSSGLVSHKKPFSRAGWWPWVGALGCRHQGGHPQGGVAPGLLRVFTRGRGRQEAAVSACPLLVSPGWGGECRPCPAHVAQQGSQRHLFIAHVPNAKGSPCRAPEVRGGAHPSPGGRAADAGG